MNTNSDEILFKKFKILSCYKKNEYSAVYLANHIYLEKKVFLKVLNTKTIHDTSIIERFKREAKILAQLQHPNIIGVYDFGMFKDFFYISFEYFKSKNLREILTKEKLDVETKKNIFIQILKGLNFAHNENVIHRDIKPENILVNEMFYVKLTDFGLAQDSIENLVTQQYSIVGTPAYMSPEQIQGENVTYKSDLFSLGITVLELFTNKNPFLGENANQTISNILSYDEDQNEEFFQNLPLEIKEVVKKLLVSDPENRINSCSEILDMLNVELAKPISYKNSNKKVFWWTLIFILVVGSFYMIFYELTKNNLHSQQIVENASDTSIIDEAILNENVKNNTESMIENEISKSDNLTHEPFDNKISEELQSIEENEIVSSSIIKYGELQVKCYPWAKVYLNDEFIETTPLLNTIVKETGKYKLSLIHPDYPAFSDTIKINEDLLTFVEVNLDTLFGYLYCQVYPWSEVYINGDKKGVTPLQFPIPLAEGKYNLTLKNPNYENFTKEISVVKGDTLKLRINLENLD